MEMRLLDSRILGALPSCIGLTRDDWNQKMGIDRKTAKSLCTADEFKLYELSQPAKLKGLTAVELRGLVVRSRTLRDKWTDVSRGQRRATQAAKARRQSDENARSLQKSELFSQIHDAFVNFQKTAQSGEVNLASGSKPVNVPRQDRKIVNRAVRSIVQGELDQTKGKINRSKRASESPAGKSVKTKASPAAKSTAAKSVSPASKTANKSTETTAAKAAAKGKTAAGPAVKKKPTAAKAPRVTAARKKALAKRAEIASSSQVKTSAASKEAGGSKVAGVPKVATAARNRNLHAKASASRVARGGATRIQGHVSAKGKRSQARRDSKG
jgi:hypothetical protein